jgi:hypothetical protein
MAGPSLEKSPDNDTEKPILIGDPAALGAARELVVITDRTRPAAVMAERSILRLARTVPNMV